MKRSLYNSEYERVRREAGLDRAEFPEFAAAPPPIDEARVKDAHEDFKQRMVELDTWETKRAAEAAARADAFTRHNNERVRLAEFARASLAPPAGTQTSLELLLWMGWKIEEADGQRVLVRPVPMKRKTREDYANESLKESF